MKSMLFIFFMSICNLNAMVKTAQLKSDIGTLNTFIVNLSGISPEEQMEKIHAIGGRRASVIDVVSIKKEYEDFGFIFDKNDTVYIFQVPLNACIGFYLLICIDGTGENILPLAWCSINDKSTLQSWMTFAATVS